MEVLTFSDKTDQNINKIVYIYRHFIDEKVAYLINIKKKDE